METFLVGGVVTIPDIGAYIRNNRRLKEKTINDVAVQTHIDLSHLARIERGEIDSLKFDDLLKIDKYLGMVGDIVTLAWEAGVFTLGLSRSGLQKEWQTLELNLALALTFIARWCESTWLDNYDWLESIRHLDQ